MKADDWQRLNVLLLEIQEIVDRNRPERVRKRRDTDQEYHLEDDDDEG